MLKNISNLGDSALYCDFGNEINRETNSHVIKYFKNLQKLNLKGITNITPSYNKLIISYDLSIVNFQNLKKKKKNLNLKETEDKEAKIIKIPICLDDEFLLFLLLYLPFLLSLNFFFFFSNFENLQLINHMR
jgi:allophanate hydrolase subunit 1